MPAYGSGPYGSGPYGVGGGGVGVGVAAGRYVSAKALELLELMPPYLTDDTLVVAIECAYGSEYQRIEDAQAAVRDAAFPTHTDDIRLPTGTRVWLASMWESLLRLPVSPVGVTIAERRAKITAHIRKRNSGHGSDWVATLSEALGTTPWSYQEGPGDYQVTIHIPHAAGTYSADQVLVLAREITPAHIDVLPAYSEGFLIGISLIGVEPL